MPSAKWRVHVNPGHLYFITTRAIQGQLLFRRDVTRRILVDSLHIGRLLGRYRLYAFVIMPNHLHCILQPLNDISPTDIVRDYKKATSNLILRQFEAEGNSQALERCAAAVKRPAKQQHAVWEDEYEAQNVFTPEFLMQKLTYIHNNPLQPKWQLADSADTYPWSSAGFYLAERRAMIPLDDVRELLA